MPTFAVQYAYDSRSDVQTAVRPDHRAFLRELATAGQLLGAGAYAEGDPGALLVFRVADSADLDGLLARDPFAIAGVITSTTVRVWNLVLGPWADEVPVA